MGTLTRKERWAAYRDEIRNTPVELLPVKEDKEHSIEDLPQDAIQGAVSAKKGIDYNEAVGKAKKKKATPKGLSGYDEYLSKKRTNLILKVIVFLLVLVGMAVWFYFIEKGR